jgi:hypothetical protein
MRLTELHRACAGLLSLLLALSGQAVSAATPKGGQMSLNLQDLKTAEEAKTAIATALPRGTSRRKVEEWLEQSGLNCFPSNLRDPYIACRHIMPSATMVHVVWSLGFFFSEHRELERIEVSRGLSGP